MKICIFEDNASAGLYPINLLRHNSEIICGAYSLKEKIENFIKQKFQLSIHCRNYLANYCMEKFPNLEINKLDRDEYVFLNSRVLFTQDFINGLLVTIDEFKNTSIISQKNILALHLSKDTVAGLKRTIEQRNDNNLFSFNLISKLKLKPIELEQLDKDMSDEIKFLEYPSDVILYNDEQLRKDLDYIFTKKKSLALRLSGVNSINKKGIHISPKSSISPYSVLDASVGNIYIGSSSVVEPFCYLRGPIYIGEHTTLRSGTKLYGPVTIGDHCKVSGEISSSILHSYVNKQHLGFLGHSYLCEWVNLGAGTTTSNLKNNYSKISLKIDGKNIDTGLIFLGSIIGDHTKTGINTMLNTGTLIGVSSNLFGSGYQPKYVSSFSWNDAQAGKNEKYEINKAVTTAKISMKRRNLTMPRAYEELLRFHFRSISKR